MLTTDRNDPRLGHGVDKEPIEQHEVYLVLSEDEISKGYTRPYCDSYIHVGIPGPKYSLRDLTEDEQEKWGGEKYIKYEEYPEGSASLGSLWTQERLDKIGKGCGVVTRMGSAIAATYARNPRFYGATYCVYCQKHLPVGEQGEFIWDDGSRRRVGT